MFNTLEKSKEIGFPTTLYKKHNSGKVGTWTISLERQNYGDGVTIKVASAKIQGGAEVVTLTDVDKGKNLGKANETTPTEQARSEIDSKIKKKLDSGYVKTFEETNNGATNALGLPMPMLAQPLKNKKLDFPVFVQPKLDGHRMLAAVQNGKVVLYSRKGIKMYLPEIQEQLEDMYAKKRWDGATLDGEIYVHGMSLQTISSYIKRYQWDHELKQGTRSLVYNIYDIIQEGTYHERRKNIDWPLTTKDAPKNIKTVPTRTVYSQQDFDKVHKFYVDTGYEGSIVRLTNGRYESDKRSHNLIKRKDFQDAEFEIVGLSYGKPNKRLGLQVGIYKCETEAGKTFDVLAPGDAQDKDYHARTGESHIGKPLTVEFFCYTPDGVPFHPVAKGIRENL